jgi:hypothetical protein
MVAADDAVSEEEIEEVGHLLEIGWHVRIVPGQMHVVESDVNDPLYLVARGFELA